ncbi:hypothetical protein BGZ73_005626 [Actinomortierella ambigua]|nr:hypothetical protein BGZ73_005626 [Actinomortierella ambigua]
MPAKLQASAVENSSPTVATNTALAIAPATEAPKRRQTSVFARLPPELVLHIFSYVDVVTMFRFMDTCSYHRHLLLDLPEAWQRVRFVPISENMTKGARHSNRPATPTAAMSSAARFYRAYQESGASSPNPSSSPTPSASPRRGVEFRQENKRDEDRGGSQSPISEVYAVLRRLRRENGLLTRVREIYMDSIDMSDYPTPLVMMFKFPNLRVLSSRHCRKQTSLATDVNILKDMLRHGHVAPHSLKLERWDIWHPYMAEDDVVGFQRALDAVCRVGHRAKGSDGHRNDQDEDNSGHSRVSSSSKDIRQRRRKGVQLDIALCPGPDRTDNKATQAVNSSLSVEIEDLQSIVHGSHTTHHPTHTHTHTQQQHQGLAIHGGGIHWTPTGTPSGTPSPEAQQQHQQQQQQQQQQQSQVGQLSPAEASTEVSPPQPQAPNYTINYGYPSPDVNLRPSRPPCSRVIWKEETCLGCGLVQERCWLCSKHCPGCGLTRSPPHVRHQQHLNIHKIRRDMMRMKPKENATAAEENVNTQADGGSSSSSSSSSGAVAQGAVHPTLVHPRPVHPTVAAASSLAVAFNVNKGSPTANPNPQFSVPEFALFD